MPLGCPPYFSSTISDDLAILCIGGGGATSVYRLPVASFDAHGNPVYAANWTVALTDPHANEFPPSMCSFPPNFARELCRIAPSPFGWDFAAI
jgi:hypothetical protein